MLHVYRPIYEPCGQKEFYLLLNTHAQKEVLARKEASYPWKSTLIGRLIDLITLLDLEPFGSEVTIPLNVLTPFVNI